MILETMLQRLYAGLARGPGLNARPHRSRQRVDFCDLSVFGGARPETALRTLLGPPVRSLEFLKRAVGAAVEEVPTPVVHDVGVPGEISVTPMPSPEPQEPAAEAPPEPQGVPVKPLTRREAERPEKLLVKLRDIAADATDYYNDYGESALFLGFPLLSLPAEKGASKDDPRTAAILAPVLLMPVNLRVRTGPRAGVTVEPAGEGADAVIPNPALLAWIEQRTGENTDDKLSEDGTEDPWAEVASVLALVARAAGLGAHVAQGFSAETALEPVPRADEMPTQPALLNSAVLGLFPLTNPGLLRDTKWMQGNERELVAPVRSFLSTAALAEGTPHPLPPAQEWDHTDPAAAPPTASRTSPASLPAQGLMGGGGAALITHADPCQAQAVAHARASDALVIHGPPGTGKSQTIANIVGDHLARGQRVLFVCDKRTALDVVKYRLDAMGLGHLCGVIHDPAHDRRGLYLGLRERLENLPQDPPAADPASELARVADRIEALRSELRAAFDGLQGTGAGESFHTLVGRWLELSAQATVTLAETEGLTLEMLDAHPADADEILRRAALTGWLENPFRGRIGIALGTWLALDPANPHEALAAAVPLAQVVDQTRVAAAGGSPLVTSLPLGAQAVVRREVAGVIAALARHEQAGVVAALGALIVAGKHDELSRELGALEAAGPVLDAPLDRELLLALGATIPGLGVINQHLAAIAEWMTRENVIARLFAFAPRKAATAALQTLGLTLSPENLSRAMTFWGGLRARWLWSDLRARLGAEAAPPALLPDAELRAVRDVGATLLAFRERLLAPECAPVARQVIGALSQLATHGDLLVASLETGAAHADALAALSKHFADTGLFSAEAVRSDLDAWITGAAAAPLAEAWLAAEPTLDEAVRLVDRLGMVPEPLRVALLDSLPHGLDWQGAQPALRAAALARLLRQRVRADATLARIDTERVEAAFGELATRTGEHQSLVRAYVAHRWDKTVRGRLLAATGSRLNSLGASLRQRLFVRGQRALKLRQMIAAGAGTQDGDPLFDVCPVWMASPATVAQIFPREALFDVIVFDEASQCRLEEALPVLLRGRRVVIAGDPKQLPPTRFFEQALAESDDIAAETAEEVFVQQQSEAEDLLTAALNLDVQEAFLDVHYRSRNEGLIGFSNDAFYSSRLQPIPGHPRNKALRVPIRIVRVEGVYEERGNAAEAEAAATLVAELLDNANPPSIGIACFNLPQRDLILDALDTRAAADRVFADRLAVARARRGPDSYEGLFVKNLENVQGDERDHMIICTTFGPDRAGRFRRNFGALSRAGGERRLNVLVTRAREAIHVLTSLPRDEYAATPGAGQPVNGRLQLYAYLRYAERLGIAYEDWQTQLETARRDSDARCNVFPTATPSAVAVALGHALHARHDIGSTVHWGNDGFCVDVALTHPELPGDVTVGLVTDFNRYRKTPDPIAWELFRTQVLRGQGWVLHRLWTPALFRALPKQLDTIAALHAANTRPVSIELPEQTRGEADDALESDGGEDQDDVS